MQGIIFIGIQASGKSTFYKENFFYSHIRISMDLMKTRNRESKILDTCLSTQAKIVIDNTNPLCIDRARYIERFQKNKYEIIGYYFSSNLNQSLLLNEKRNVQQRVPEVGIKATYRKLEIPKYSEGFDRLYYVKLENQKFQVDEWNRHIE